MILLSFDTEEFDFPREQGHEFSLQSGMRISSLGTKRILDVLQKTGVKATFFCTANFVKHAPELTKRIIAEGHELACHGVDHFQPQTTDVIKSKQLIEKATSQKTYGYRQPRMMPTKNSDFKKAHYLYNASLNPAFIPGRYMHLSEPRTPFIEDDIVQIPASVTPHLRLPLFWLSFRLLPVHIYNRWARRVLKHDQLLVMYSHPWEFADLATEKSLKLPYIIKHNSGKIVTKRLENFIKTFQKQGAEFSTYTEYTKKFLKQNK